MKEDKGILQLKNGWVQDRIAENEGSKLPAKRLNVLLSELLSHVETNIYETYYGLNCVPPKDAEVPIPSTTG